MRWFSPLHPPLHAAALAWLLQQFREAALRSFRPGDPAELTLLTAAVWLLEGFRLFFVIEALGVEGLHLSLPVIIFVALASSLLTALPLTPAAWRWSRARSRSSLTTFFNVEKNLSIAVTLLDRLD